MDHRTVAACLNRVGAAAPADVGFGGHSDYPDTDDALLAAYRDHFGIVLSRVPDGRVRERQ